MAELKALCMSCRDENKKPTMQTMQDPQIEEKNNRYSARGTCAKCGGKTFAFLGKDKAEEIRRG